MKTLDQVLDEMRSYETELLSELAIIQRILRAARQPVAPVRAVPRRRRERGTRGA